MAKTIIAVIFFLFAGTVFVMYTKPTYATVGVTQAQIDQYNEALDKANQIQALKQKLLGQLNSFNTRDTDRLHKFLPDHVDNIGLILDFDSMASRYGMALENVDVSSKDPAASKQSAIGAIGPDAQKHDSLTLHFSTTGSYENFRSFLNDIEHSLRLVDLVSFSVTPQGATPGEGASSANYRYDITVRTYWLK